MNMTNRLLDEAKAALQVPSDYALAKRLGMHHSTISGYRAQRSQLDVDACFRVAEVLGREPAAIIAAVEAERATKPEVKEAWIQRLKQLGGVAAGIAIFLSGALPAPAESMTAAHNGDIRALHRPDVTVFRSGGRRTGRGSRWLSRWFEGLFSRPNMSLFAATAHP